MKCPECNHVDTKVTDTRISADHTSIRRRRKCLQCGYRFSTVEVYCKMELLVIKRSGREEEFDADKIVCGLRRAIRSDEFSERKIDKIMQNISRNIFTNYSKKVSTETIGQIVMEELKQIDPIAYLRFVSIHKNFHEANEFKQEFKNLEN
ncbi:MAG: transcriptional regulator NrdR [Puniceicoccales bacterium]|jgi:transcriptional repressor NrdR|nr:transcriptional regulator NrdR [Puniceicoccales bacterium]